MSQLSNNISKGLWPFHTKWALNNRQKRLFAVACCHPLLDLLPDERGREVLAVAERFADGQTTIENLNNAREEMVVAWQEPQTSLLCSFAYKAIAQALVEDAQIAYRMTPLHTAAVVARQSRTNPRAVKEKQQLAQQWLLDDIHGPPRRFRIQTALKDCITEQVVCIAQLIYEARTFQNMPILADALEEAGCTNEMVLDHCRSSDEHTRGCWLIDSVLRA